MVQQQTDVAIKLAIILTKHVVHRVVQTNTDVLAEHTLSPTDVAELVQDALLAAHRKRMKPDAVMVHTLVLTDAEEPDGVAQLRHVHQNQMKVVRERPSLALMDAVVQENVVKKDLVEPRLVQHLDVSGSNQPINLSAGPFPHEIVRQAHHIPWFKTFMNGVTVEVAYTNTIEEYTADI